MPFHRIHNFGLQPVPRASGAQRMREFRLRHPEYDRQCKARSRAREAACQAALQARKTAAFAEVLARPTPLLLPAPPVRLALPAPVLDPTMAALNALAMKRIREPVAAPR
jgi:hypothetical protein